MKNSIPTPEYRQDTLLEVWKFVGVVCIFVELEDTLTYTSHHIHLDACCRRISPKFRLINF